MFLPKEGITGIVSVSQRHNCHFQGAKDTLARKTVMTVKFRMATNFTFSIQELAFEAVAISFGHV